MTLTPDYTRSRKLIAYSLQTILIMFTERAYMIHHWVLQQEFNDQKADEYTVSWNRLCTVYIYKG